MIQNVIVPSRFGYTGFCGHEQTLLVQEWLGYRWTHAIHRYADGWSPRLCRLHEPICRSYADLSGKGRTPTGDGHRQVGPHRQWGRGTIEVQKYAEGVCGSEGLFKQAVALLHPTSINLDTMNLS